MFMEICSLFTSSPCLLLPKKKRKEKQFFIAFGDVLAAAAPIWNESLFIAYFEGQGNDPFQANVIEKIWQLNRA